MTIFVCFFVVLTFLDTVQADDTRWFNFRGISKIAVVFGSFDPPHKDHQIMIDWISKQPGIGGVLVLPNSFAPHKPGISDYEHRWNMLATLYLNNRKIIIPTLEEGLKLGSWRLLAKLRNNNKHLMFTAYVGEDWAESFLKFTALKIIWPIDQWIVMGRSENSDVGIQIKGKSGLSSSKIRDDLDHYRDALDPAVYRYILRENLYTGLNCIALFN